MTVTDAAAPPGPSGDGAGGPTATRKPGPLAWLGSMANSLIVPVLALVTALALGGLVIVFSDPDTLDSWGGVFSHPGRTLSDSWDVVYDSYKGLYTSWSRPRHWRWPGCLWRSPSGPGCSTSGVRDSSWSAPCVPVGWDSPGTCPASYT